VVEEEERARRWRSDGGGLGYMAAAQAEVRDATRATCRRVFSVPTCNEGLQRIKGNVQCTDDVLTVPPIGAGVI
jgi:hypothetical protein